VRDFWKHEKNLKNQMGTISGTVTEIDKKRLPTEPLKALILVVPEARLELARA